jgi:hypothetical protein
MRVFGWQTRVRNESDLDESRSSGRCIIDRILMSSEGFE